MMPKNRIIVNSNTWVKNNGQFRCYFTWSKMYFTEDVKPCIIDNRGHKVAICVPVNGHWGISSPFFTPQYTKLIGCHIDTNIVKAKIESIDHAKRVVEKIIYWGEKEPDVDRLKNINLIVKNKKGFLSGSVVVKTFTAYAYGDTSNMNLYDYLNVNT